MKSVYLLLNKETNYIKVGITKNVNKRKKTLELQSGCPLLLIYNTDVLNRYRTIEHSFKQYFKLEKQQGEWFSIDKQTAIETLQYIMQNLERSPLPL